MCLRVHRFFRIDDVYRDAFTRPVEYDNRTCEFVARRDGYIYLQTTNV